MSDVRLACDGLTIQDSYLPPFQVEAGKSVCLHIRLPSPMWQEELVPILCGRVSHPAIHLRGSVTYLERPLPRRRWWGKRYNPSAGDWLTTERGLTSSQVEAVLRSVGESAELSVGRIGWNERTMLDLEACLLRPPDLLVFDLSGNDPMVAPRVFKRLASRTPLFALLYLKTRFHKEDPCLPDAACLEMDRVQEQATIAE